MSAVVGPALHGQRTLGDLGDHPLDGDRSTALAESSSTIPSPSSAAMATTIAPSVRDLPEPGGDVAPQLDELEIRSQRRELGPATHGSGGDGAPASRSRAATDERIPRIAPLGERGDHQTRGRVEGRSLARWTARSAPPSSTACCTSLTNTPRPPMHGAARRTLVTRGLDRGRAPPRSPVRPPAARRSATTSACDPRERCRAWPP